MVFRPLNDRTRWEGLIVCVWLVLLDLLMLFWSVQRPVDWIKFGLVFVVLLSLPLLLYWAYRTWAAFTLEYWVDRNAVTLRWANVRQLIPMTMILQLSHEAEVSPRRTSPWHWPAPYLHPAGEQDGRPLYMAASRPLDECMFVETDAGLFAVSPRQPEELVDAIQVRYEMGPAQALPLEMLRTAYRERLLGSNWLGPTLIAAGLLGVLVLVGVLMVNFPSLPDVLGFQYNSDGIPVVVRSKSALFLLPVIGFLTWFVNGLGGIWMSSRSQPTGAYLLWGGTIVVQACSLLAMISIIP